MSRPSGSSARFFQEIATATQDTDDAAEAVRMMEFFVRLLSAYDDGAKQAHKEHEGRLIGADDIFSVVDKFMLELRSDLADKTVGELVQFINRMSVFYVECQSAPDALLEALMAEGNTTSASLGEVTYKLTIAPGLFINQLTEIYPSSLSDLAEAQKSLFFAIGGDRSADEIFAAADAVDAAYEALPNDVQSASLSTLCSIADEDKAAGYSGGSGGSGYSGGASGDGTGPPDPGDGGAPRLG